MREVAGEYNTAKIFTDVVDDASIAQVKELCDQEFCTGSRIRLCLIFMLELDVLLGLQ